MRTLFTLLVCFISVYSFGADISSVIEKMNNQSFLNKNHIKLNKKVFLKLPIKEQTDLVKKLEQYSAYFSIGNDFYVLDKDVLFSKEKDGERITLIYSYVLCRQCYYFEQMLSRIDEQKGINPNFRNFKNKQFYTFPLVYPSKSEQTKHHTFDFIAEQAIYYLIPDADERKRVNQALMLFGNTEGVDKLTSYSDMNKFFKANTDKITLEKYRVYFSDKKIEEEALTWGKELSSKLTFGRLPSIIVDGKFQIGHSKFAMLASDEQLLIDILDMLSILSDLERRKIISFKNRS